MQKIKTNNDAKNKTNAAKNDATKCKNIMQK